jgi:hypothetical protein
MFFQRFSAAAASGAASCICVAKAYMFQTQRFSAEALGIWSFERF